MEITNKMALIGKRMVLLLALLFLTTSSYSEETKGTGPRKVQFFGEIQLPTKEVNAKGQTIASQSATNKDEKSNPETSSLHTGIKAFDNLFFGEEKSVVQRKQKNFVKVGERLFEFSCGYEKIGGKDRLSQVNLFATWTDVQESVIKANLDEIKEVLSAKFGEPDWHIGSYEGRMAVFEQLQLGYVPSYSEIVKANSKNDDRYATQYRWKIGEEKTVNVFMRDQTIQKERKETVEVSPANFFHAAKTEEVSRFDEHREYKIWIEIESPTVKKMKAKEDANSF